MVAVALGDEVSLERPSAGGESHWEISPAEDAQASLEVDWKVEDDLAVRAHRAVERHVGRPLAVQGRVAKRVPPGTGLGGGSADAAATLLGVNALFDLALSWETLHSLAAELGSDVPFALLAADAANYQMAQFSKAGLAGSGSCYATGTGGAVQPRSTPATPVVIVLPPLACHTGRVYQAFDRLTPTTHVNASRVQALIAQHATHPVPPEAELFNDLTQAALHVEPRLANVVSRLSSAGHHPHVTGSGAAVFLIAESPAAAKRLADQASRLTGCVCIPTQTLATTRDV